MRYKVTIEGQIEPHLYVEFQDYLIDRHFKIGDRSWELQPTNGLIYVCYNFYIDGDLKEATSIGYLFQEAEVSVEDLYAKTEEELNKTLGLVSHDF